MRSESAFQEAAARPPQTPPANLPEPWRPRSPCKAHFVRLAHPYPCQLPDSASSFHLRQHLHCHVAIEPCVPRAIHFAHAARTEGGGDAVLIDYGVDHFLSRNSSNQFSTTNTF